MQDLKDLFSCCFAFCKVGQRVAVRLSAEERKQLRLQDWRLRLEGVVAAVKKNDKIYKAALHSFCAFHSHTHHACCYDEIKGNQDHKIYSHADSPILCVPRAIL